MSQIQTNAATGDLVLEDATIVVIDGIEEIAQHVRVRLRLLRGEVPMRQDLGLPVFDEILIKAPSYDVISQIIRDTIQGTPGIVSVEELDIGAIDPLTRVSVVTFSATASLANLSQRIPLHDTITVQLQGVE